ncbi:hypothetical protein ABZ567_27905 [Streptomyces sp. NPDC016459]|uniref:hypothetical protein n=1 Tax=Streptomyces sp. NPDC016459 TaxID=3157190 RepID=UPI003403EB56
MGIESDQLVYDYLSRVGDLAQQRQLPASDRMRLVSTLRNEIDRQRATNGEESPTAVRGILGALGTPDEVVERAGAPEKPPSVPKPRGRGRGARRSDPGPGSAAAGPGEAAGSDAAGPGAAAGSGEARRPAGPGSARPGSAAARSARPGSAAPGSARPGSAVARSGAARSGVAGDGVAADGVAAVEPDWWRSDAADPGEGFAGFVGGVERPDLFEPPAPDEDETGADGAEGKGEPPGSGRRRRLARILRRRRRGAAVAEPEPAPEAATPVSRLRVRSPFVLLAALLLLGGAVFSSLIALAGGWLLAYASRRLTPGEVKTAVLVIPGLAAASGVAWLWGRVEGRWGEPVTAGGEAMGAAVSETWPWTLRGAAIASALFLLWRARRH